GACAGNGLKCESNLDCCSDSCVKGQCVENYQCQDCIKSGKLSAGQKCCADEAYEKNGQCVPLVVPLNPFVKVFEGFLNLIIPSAHARMDVIQDGDGGGGGGGRRPSGSTDVNAQYR